MSSQNTECPRLVHLSVQTQTSANDGAYAFHKAFPEGILRVHFLEIYTLGPSSFGVLIWRNGRHFFKSIGFHLCLSNDVVALERLKELMSLCWFCLEIRCLQCVQ